MFTILDYSSALEYSIIRRYTNIVYYYYYYTTMWIEVPLMPLIYNMFQVALLINLQIMIHNLSILFNAQDSAART